MTSFLKNTRLGLKFTLVLLLFFVGGTILSWVALSRALEQIAEDEVNAKGLLLIATMNAVRGYTSSHVNPLLAARLETEPDFIPETVPAFSAREVFETFRSNEAYQTFFYKEATLNPTNERNLVDDFEAELVQRFRNNPELKEISGFRTVNGQSLFYSARPLAIGSESCLRCHGDPAAAPASLTNTYGADGGFGWQLNEVVAAQMIYVPAERVSDTVWISLSIVMAVFILVFALVILMINLLLRRNVIQPLGQMAALAELIGADKLSGDGSELARLDNVTGRGDELGQLSRVFQRMAREVYSREQQLKQQVQQLRIQIDEVKKAQDVAQITDSEYFQELQQKAGALRDRRKNREGK